MSEITWGRSGVAIRQKQLVGLLIEERKRRGIRQQDLARRLHQHQSFVSRLESGARRIDVFEFLNLAQAIGFNPNNALKRIQNGGARNGSKAKAKSKRKDGAGPGPTCVVRYCDGQTVRMTVSTSLGILDWTRGLRLAEMAHQSRWRARQRKQTGAHTVDLSAPAAPPIVEAYFERDGEVLARYPGSESVSP
jgi:transcriptional regulator with XRE-family HTH domain